MLTALADAPSGTNAAMSATTSADAMRWMPLVVTISPILGDAGRRTPEHDATRSA
jgi:hypothetical protein